MARIMAGDIPGNVNVVAFKVASRAATATDVSGFFRAPAAIKITNLTVTFNSAVTGANTNNFKVYLINRGTSGAGTTSVGEVTFASGVNAGAKVPYTITVTNPDVAAGELLEAGFAVNGSGLASDVATIQFDYRFA